MGGDTKSKSQSADYDIGYKKPPKSTQFQKGMSGNPRGRPRGSKNKIPPVHEEKLESILLEEFYRGVEIREGGGNLTVPMVQAVTRSIAVNALKGGYRAQKLFLDTLHATEAKRSARHQAYFEAALDYKRRAEQEIAYRKSKGDDTSDIIPHPDSIKINPRTGDVTIKGPIDKDEQVLVDNLKAYCQDIIGERDRDIADMDNPEYEGLQTVLQEQIDWANKMLAKIDRWFEA